MAKFQIRPSVGLRTAVLLLSYAATLAFSLWVAYLLRFDFQMTPKLWNEAIRALAWAIPIKIVFLALFGQFSGLLRYFSIPDLRRLFLACLAGSVTLLFLRHYPEAGFGSALFGERFGGAETLPFVTSRGVILIDFLVSFPGLASVRVGFRVLQERYYSPSGSRQSRRAKRTAIIGAGDVGASLVRDLTSKRGLGLHPVAIFDDDSSKWKRRIHDVPVIGAPEMLLNRKLNLQLEEVIIAMPSASGRRMREIVGLLQKSRLRFVTVPAMDQLATGRVKVSQLREVEIDDLLGREPVSLETENIRQIVDGRVAMVTGGGGSIGSELCRQVATFNPKRLLVVEQSEVQLFQIEQELIEKGFSGMILPLVADVLDDGRMRYLFDRFRPQIVFHAAAHKHVPLMESQPSESIKNNVMGTAHVAELALQFEVERFILVSTDKAINPTNVMGATKRMAEIFLQALYASQPDRTKFMAVRFGNVLGSSGSVVPTFKKQIAAGGPVKVTHPEITRYFMTIPESVGLVLQSAAQGVGGEIFVLDMGSPVRIVDLARQLIELSGLRPDEDIEIQFVGLRPGEKLFEELSYKGENITVTEHPKIMRFVSEPLPLKEVRSILDELARELHRAEPNQLKQLLKKAVPEYQPYLT